MHKLQKSLVVLSLFRFLILCGALWKSCVKISFSVWVKYPHFKEFSPVAKGVWYDKLGGNLPPIWMSTIMSKVSKKIGCQKILLVNVHFTDQNHDRPGFSVFLLTPGNM